MRFFKKAKIFPKRFIPWLSRMFPLNLPFSCVFFCIASLALTFNAVIFNQMFLLRHQEKSKHTQQKSLQPSTLLTSPDLRVRLNSGNNGFSSTQLKAAALKVLNTDSNLSRNPLYSNISKNNNSSQGIGPPITKSLVSENITAQRNSSHPVNINKVSVNSMATNLISEDFFKDITMPASKCSDRFVELLLCVPSQRDGWKKRKTIRSTWGSFAKFTGGLSGPIDNSTINSTRNRHAEKKSKICLVFFLGNSSEADSQEEQEAIDREASEYGDIYQADFIDTYENLTLKSISILRFVSLNCPNTRFVAKVDDDVYLNVPVLLSVLRKQENFVIEKMLNKTNMKDLGFVDPIFAIGDKFEKAIVLRNKTDKWYTPREVYREDRYPTYLSGTAYAMSGPTAVALYKASVKVPLFWMEDIYITGLCARQAGVTLLRDKGFSVANRGVTGCSMEGAISSHGHTDEELLKIHRELSDPALKCPA